jgi:hypothetical protein
MKNHPYSEIFPLLDGAALEELVADIRMHGLREPIVTYRGEILDGRNRAIACQKANVKPIYTVYTGSAESALAWVVSANIHRRHLTVEQRAFAASRIAALREGDNQHSSKKSGSNDEPAPRGASSKSSDSPSQTEAAEKLGVSRRSVQRARKIDEKGSAALRKAAESGEVPLARAAAVVDLPKSEQLAAAKEKPVAPTPDEDPERPAEDEDGVALEAAERDWRVRMDKILEADDRLAEMAKQLKLAQDELTAAKQARDRYMNENAALLRQNKALQRKLDRLEKKAA